MKLTNCTLGQLYFLARNNDEYRIAALVEIDRRIPRNETSRSSAIPQA